MYILPMCRTDKHGAAHCLFLRSYAIRHTLSDTPWSLLRQNRRKQKNKDVASTKKFKFHVMGGQCSTKQITQTRQNKSHKKNKEITLKRINQQQFMKNIYYFCK